MLAQTNENPGESVTIERIQSGPRMSQVVVHNKTVYLSGQVAESARGASVTVQTREILSSIDRLLANAKTDKSRLLSATIWLTDMGTFSEMNRVWESWVVPGSTPARATVLSPQLAAVEFKIEIAVVAAQP
jgi:enamine deaminase RidA (YjgF/YER057c/UK114 family)